MHLAAADTDAARDAIATAEESRKAIQNSEPLLKDVSYDDGVIKENENQERAKTKWWLVITLTMDLKGMIVLGYVMWQSYRWNSIPTIMAAILTLAHLLRFEERGMHTSDQKEVVFQGIRLSHLRRRMKYGHLTQGGLNDT